jgi:predicted O-methyltransferase YrrM
MGAVQRDEALVLHALVRALRPQTLIEFGSGAGHSSYNFLRALAPTPASTRLMSI